MIKFKTKTKMRDYYRIQGMIKKSGWQADNVLMYTKIALNGLPDELFDELSVGVDLCTRKRYEFGVSSDFPRVLLGPVDEDGKVSCPRLIISCNGFRHQSRPDGPTKPAGRLVLDKEGMLRKPIARFIEDLMVGEL